MLEWYSKKILIPFTLYIAINTSIGKYNFLSNKYCISINTMTGIRPVPQLPYWLRETTPKSPRP